jgi:DNA-binding CsgD family transcriptional regulator
MINGKGFIMESVECQGFDPSNIESSISIFNQIPECIHWKDKNLKYVLMNNYTAQVVGYPSSDASFDGVSDEKLPCKASELSDTFAKEDRIVLNTGKTMTIITLCCYGGNEWRLILGRKSPLKNKSNETIGVYGRGIDVTECGLMRTTFMIFVQDEKRHGKSRNALNQSSYLLKETIDDYGLSTRESECLFFLIRGKTAKEIAQILKISFRTVEKHLERLKYKMNCFSRSEIIEKAISEGLGTVIPKSTLIPSCHF